MTNETKLFYKYQRIDDDDSNHTFENLAKNQLYFNDPSNFNDPFDSKFNIKYEGTEEEWISFSKIRGFNEFDVKQLVKDGILRRRNRKLILNLNSEKFRKRFNKKHGYDFGENKYNRVCCFSGKDSNILMWSHYSESHRGICLRFRSENIENGYFLTLGSEKELFFPVVYPLEDDEKMPKQVNMLADYNPEELGVFLCSKHSDWKYENEYRLILEDEKFDDKFTKKYRKEDLEGIIFGLKIPSDHIKKIYEIIDKHYLKQGIKVNFYKAQEVQGKYAIKIKKIDRIEKYLESLG